MTSKQVVAGPTAAAQTTFISQTTEHGRQPGTRERFPWLLGLVCLLIGILPSYVVAPGPLKSNGSPVKLIAILLLALTGLGFLAVRRGARTARLSPGMVFLLGYFLATLLVYGVGIAHTGTVLEKSASTRYAITLLANVGVSAYAMTRIESARQRSFLLGATAIGLTFNCIVGLLQHLTTIDLHLLFQPPGFTLTDPNQFLATGTTLSERSGSKRAVGTTLHPIEFSVLCAVTVPLTLHFARYGRFGWTRLLGAVGAVVAIVALPAGVSRTGLVTLAAAMLVYIWSFKLRAICTAAAVGAAALLVEFVLSPQTARAMINTVTNASQDTSVQARIADYGRVSESFRAHPIFGRGLGGTPASEFGWLDNEWLQALVQGGIVGFSGMLIIAVGALFGAAAALRGAAGDGESSRRDRDQAFAMGSILIGILASSTTFDLFSYQSATILLFMLFGLTWCNFHVYFVGAKQSFVRAATSRLLLSRSHSRASG
ncbi:MAG: O-antigen ligase family protein [Candidatus Nanopelagicales bacterium]